MAHTPGPWVAEASNDLGEGMPVTIFSADGYGDAVAAVAGHGYVDDPNNGATAETWANARLIAAAPDLLATARNALQVARDPWNYTEMEQIAILDAVEAVIAKAEGRE